MSLPYISKFQYHQKQNRTFCTDFPFQHLNSDNLMTKPILLPPCKISNKKLKKKLKNKLVNSKNIQSYPKITRLNCQDPIIQSKPHKCPFTDKKGLITQDNPCDCKNKARHCEEEQGDKIPCRPFPDLLGLDSQTLCPSKRIDLLQQVEFEPFLLQFFSTLSQQLPILFFPL